MLLAPARTIIFRVPRAHRPFLARLHALSRRARSSAAAGNSEALRDHAIRLGQLTIKPESYCAEIDGRSIDLAGGEFRLLWELAVHRGATVLNDQLARIGPHPEDLTTMKTVEAHVNDQYGGNFLQKSGRTGNDDLPGFRSTYDSSKTGYEQ